ncbi:MAG: OmpA family protein [Lachnospiraceae bacterium]|nr:OmpA family protein [Lachnospiraceae bacterium]MCR5688296.1 OmpA family protein [Lachnospiraceae bacterium]
MRRANRLTRDEETSYWLSYSDMMAGLLLCFVLIISLTVLRSKVMYDEKQNELAGKEQELIIQSQELENERLTIEEQGAKLNAQELKLSEQEGELLAQQRKLEEQSRLLKELEELMGEQQAKLDNIIGIRSELIEALKKEFEHSSLSIAVDENTGAITMDSSILFEYNRSVLKSGGRDFLGEFMPRYLKILLSPKYRNYISEIVIEGHTDTDGSYLSNLELSQQRAYSVADYCTSPGSDFLTDREKEELEKVLSTVGRSYSEPILRPDGSVDATASRRVEILFRLRDEEMIREMMEILNETSNDR